MSILTNPGPVAFEGYYYGLVDVYYTPKLLARSNPASWAIPKVLDPCGYEGIYCRDKKTVFVVTHHPLRDKLDQGLRDKILSVLSTMSPPRWISVDYLRLGYDKEVPKNNPVVVLITVEEDQVSRPEAQRIVDTLFEECKK